MQPFRGSRYANVTATVALVAALGGTSYAAASLPSNSVGSKQIKSDAVSSKKIKDGSLLAKDFGSGQIPAGPAGPAGAKGAAGPAGPASLPALDYNTSAAVNIAAGATVPGGVACDAGMYAVGGGAFSDGAGMTVDSSYPSAGGGGWSVYMRNESGAARTFKVHVICTSTAVAPTLKSAAGSERN
jgi:hypothetical protein